ncbi:hypothetical protein CAEBREN_13634 [Caenorhabditis brenneri]|uniref:Sdz-33 F-box domain-containing protein n=1 Tax=Caenorhabditis brenneri TaxID=135651 RepID=G0MC02_CAEBE|nr:hypothetical protein CAEBREN_13634 [Caenorhabditis brenneri]
MSKSKLGFSTVSNKTKNIVASSNLKLKMVRLFVRQKCGMVLFFGWWGSLKHVGIEFLSDHVVAHALFDDDDSREYDFFRNWSSNNFRDYLEHILLVTSSSKQIDEVIFLSRDIPVSFAYSNLKRIDIKKIQIATFCTHQYSRQILSRFLEVDSFILPHNPYETVTGSHGFLMRNLNDFRLDVYNNAFKFTLNDLLVSNSKNIVISWSGWTEKNVNRFLKLWIKGSNPNLKSVDIWFPREHLINQDIVLEGIVTHELGRRHFSYHPEEHRYGIKRKDGPLAALTIQSTHINIPHIQLDVDPDL